MHSDQETTKALRARLLRARGQLTAVIAMLDEERDCADVITLLAAVSRALDKAGLVALTAGLSTCAATGPDADAERRRLERLLLSLR